MMIFPTGDPSAVISKKTRDIIGVGEASKKSLIEVNQAITSLVVLDKFYSAPLMDKMKGQEEVDKKRQYEMSGH